MAKSNNKPKSLDGLLDLVRRHCTGSKIQDVLRDAKELNQDVRISGKNKSAIMGNLRDALNLNAASPDGLHELVCESEESGHQLIRLFTPATKAVEDRCNDGEGIAVKLLGANWRSQYNFPISNVDLKGEAWGDFRIDSSSPRGSNWTAKLDAGITKKVYVKQDEKGDEIMTLYRKVPVQEAYLIKWHNHGLLEIRSPIGDSNEARLEAYNRVTEAIKNAVDVGNGCNAIDLRPALLKIRAKVDSPEGSELFSWVNLEIASPVHGTAWVKACSSDDNFLQQAMNREIFDHFGSCNRAAIAWNFDKVNVVSDWKKPVLTHIGVHGLNTVHIRANSSAKAVRYVVDTLRRLA